MCIIRPNLPNFWSHGSSRWSAIACQNGKEKKQNVSVHGLYRALWLTYVYESNTLPGGTLWWEMFIPLPISVTVTPEQKAKQLELYKGLDERKSKLDSVLQDKIKELKALCLKESEITGELPHEYTLFMSPGEKTPTIKKRMGTAFSIAGK